MFYDYCEQRWTHLSGDEMLLTMPCVLVLTLDEEVWTTCLSSFQLT